jgi:hypothetical protein
MLCSWAEFFGQNCRKIRRAICKWQRSSVLSLSMPATVAPDRLFNNINDNDNYNGNDIGNDNGNGNLRRLASQSSASAAPSDESRVQVGRTGVSFPPIGPGNKTVELRQLPWAPPCKIQAPH